MTAYGIGCDVASYILRDVRYSSWVRSLSRPALYRIQTILASLINGDVVTAKRMAGLLEVSARTIARDIDYLINTLHVPVKYNNHRFTYELTGPVPVLFAPHAGTQSDVVPAAAEVLITMQVDADLVHHFKAVELHPSQHFTQAADGSGTLQLTVPLTDSLVQWIMSYGGKITVTSPQSLRDRVHSLALSIITNHRPRN